MRDGAGKRILDEAVFAGLPLGVDPAQARAQQDKDGGAQGAAGEAGGAPPAGGDPEAGAGEDKDVTVPHQSLVSFQAFYVEGDFEAAARLAAEVLGVGARAEAGTVDEEKERAEWARFLSEQETKFSFLRKSMLKFNTFLGTAKGSWDKLSDPQKESAVKFLKGKASKMSSELKNLLGGLTATSPADKVLMAAMLAYMFGVGMSGEGAAATESGASGEE